MTQIVIANAKILSDDGRSFIRDIFSRDGRIVSVKKSGRLERNSRGDEGSPSPRFYDARHNIVLPGLIDCHVHMFSLGLQNHIVDLRGLRSLKQVRSRIEKFLDSPRDKISKLADEWILGRGWDQDLFPGKTFPESSDIDPVTGRRPALLVRVCGHVGLLNSEGVRRLSTDFFQRCDSTLLPRNRNGALTGIVKEEALGYCEKIAYPKSRRALRKMFLEAQNMALGSGLTAVHCILSEQWSDELAVIRSLDEAGKLILKTSVLLYIGALEQVEAAKGEKRALMLGEGSQKFRVIGFKLYADGSLGARTAALLAPYSDDPKTSGILYYNKDHIAELARRVKRLKLVLAVHAIGDAAIAQVLCAFRKAGIRARDGFRIEHCSVLNGELLRSLKGVTISIQPSFATSDYWLEDRLGHANLCKREAYPFRSLVRFFREHVIAGSDAPTESVSPLLGVLSAIENPLKGETLKLKEAIRLYTSSAARASPLTITTGRLVAGYDCDLVVFNVKSFDQIRSAKVIGSFIDGREQIWRKVNPSSSIVSSSNGY